MTIAALGRELVVTPVQAAQIVAAMLEIRSAGAYIVCPDEVFVPRVTEATQSLVRTLEEIDSRALKTALG